MLDHNQKVVESQQLSIESMAHWSVYAAELIGIFYAISLVLKVVSLRPRTQQLHSKNQQQSSACHQIDSMSALQAMRNPRNKSGQQIIHATLQAASGLKTWGIPLPLQWIPGHCDDPGNDAADRLARRAVGSNKIHPFCRLVSLKSGNTNGRHPKRVATFGGSTQSCLPSAPADYTIRCHGTEPIYLRNCGLVTAGKLHGHREDDKCECGAKETVIHVLEDCPKLRMPQQKLRRELGETFSDIPAMLGGKGETSHMKAILDFAEAS
jgi:ribonuclease HI